MKNFVPIPVIDSSLYLFGGHMRTVPGGWQFFEQKHQAFELMCVIDGRQTTEIKGVSSYSYGAGDVMIISPGTLHTNKNSSDQDPMTYICFHFNIESLQLKSEMIRNIVNTVIPAEQPAAQAAIKAAKTIVRYSAEHQLSKEQSNLKIQIALLEFFFSLTEELKKYLDQKGTNKYTESEARTSRLIVTLIKRRIDKKKVSPFSFSDICQKVGISSGYGHRTFKKVYGITPLHYIESQKYNKAKLLLGTEYSIEDVSYLMGASSISNFSKQFKKWSGITPSKYQRQMKQKRRVRTTKEGGYFE